MYHTTSLGLIDLKQDDGYHLWPIDETIGVNIMSSIFILLILIFNGLVSIFIYETLKWKRK